MFTHDPIDCGDSLSIMRQLPGAFYNAIITDPPYASGGLTTAERKASPERKYISRGRHPSFDFDTRDQRSHFMWSVLWMTEALRLTCDGGWLMVCSDWRQLPTTSDALQVAGWTWRSVVTWGKTEACRPHQGMFRSQSEFILVATRGSIVLDPFTGSGTTVVAARQLGHTAHGIDISPVHVQIARDRLANLAD